MNMKYKWVKKMENKIYVLNSIRVGDFIKTKLNDKEDLLLNKDKKVIDFINKYQSYLYTDNPKEIKTFYDETGLIITHVYHVKSCRWQHRYVLINLNGVFLSLGDFLCEEAKVFNEHLYIETNVESIDIINNKVVIDGKEVFDEFYRANGYASKLDRNYKEKEKFQSLKRYPLDINLLKENGFRLPNEDITYCTTDLFNNAISLTSSNDLYFNEKLYSKNVEAVVEFNSENIFFIYKDNVIEEYSSLNRKHNKIRKCEKVLWDNTYIIYLKDKTVGLYLLPVDLDYYFLENGFIGMSLYNVDDIEVRKLNGSISGADVVLYLYKNNEKIELLLPIVNVSRNYECQEL